MCCPYVFVILSQFASHSAYSLDGDCLEADVVKTGLSKGMLAALLEFQVDKLWS